MGYLKLPKNKPVKKIGNPFWFSNVETKTGKRIKRFMSEKQAQEFVSKSGFPIYRKMKKYELHERY